MAEHLFLCGLSASQRAEFEGGEELHLHGHRRNVRLYLDDIRKHLLEVEPELLTDLAEIATYVFAADCAVSRGGPAFEGMGKAWRREFRLVIAVRQPALWREPQRLRALRDVIQFLSDETWSFEFVTLSDPPGIQAYLGIRTIDLERQGDSTVMLFSGGLDSFAGAVHELNTSNRHVVLVSRRVGGLTDRRQRELAAELKSSHPRRVTHIPVEVGLTEETAAVEHTQRTRSFLFAAIAIVAAVLEASNRVRFYENGIMSVNLPIATQVVATRASRSTHPRSLLLLNNLVKLIDDGEITIDNPFARKTKVDVVRELMQRPERKLIRQTLSCSHTRDLNIYKPHCGTCAQCIQRRISTLGADAADEDPASGYAIDLITGPLQNGDDRRMAFDIVRSAVEYRTLSEFGFAQRFASELGWITAGFPDQNPADVARDFISMFLRHGDSVRSIFVAATGEHKAALFDKTLSESCLLRVWYEVGDPRSKGGHQEGGESPTVKEPADQVVELPEEVLSRDILLALDDVHKLVRIEGIAPIRGASDYRLISVLVEMHREDREAELLPENYRTISAKDLATEVSTSGDTSGRQAVRRLRKRINEEFDTLFPGTLDQNAVVENVPGKGYRLNPTVRVVAYDQLDRSKR